MNLLCRLRRHKWRTYNEDGRSYVKCERCGHYRAMAHWADNFDDLNLPPGPYTGQ